MRAKYDEFVAAFQPQDEIRASHILVKTKEEADAIKADLDGGADFATIAKEKSIDPGAANGGDLGFFGKGMMVGPFEDAAFALTDIGQVSAPVESQFGWHIIKLEERRKSSAPPIEQVGAQLQQQLLMTTFDDAVAKLMEGTKVDIPDAALAAGVAAQTEPAEAAPRSGAIRFRSRGPTAPAPSAWRPAAILRDRFRAARSAAAARQRPRWSRRQGPASTSAANSPRLIPRANISLVCVRCPAE